MFPTFRHDTVDHIAIAVRDLEAGITYYTTMLGFELTKRRTTMGEYSSMNSAVLWSGEFSVVLLEATSEQSQVHQFIQEYGPGVQHIAFKVEDIEKVRETLLLQRVEFATNVIRGAGLKQMFTRRDKNSGVMIEYIERIDESDFIEDNINSLFAQLEKSGEY